ncbi:uncharacterized protein LOC143028545 [Oratosquilla oratoria]|uniref:uncharacterized protein LOC143028545 n=1 Tax=Oratosquilla oratoria TaxID=337810 RepID=UPI003F7745AC
MADNTAECTAFHFLLGWVANLGAPHMIIMDQGPQWDSKAWTDLLLFLGTSRQRTTAYHPQANNMVEHFHRRLKEALHAQPHPVSWADALPIVLLNILSTVKEDLQLTPAELVYGKDLRLPSQYMPALDMHSELAFMAALRQAMRVFTPQPPKPPAASTTYQHPMLMSADKVFFRVDARTGSLVPKYSGPRQVLAHAAKHITLKIGSRHSTVS